MVKITSKSHIFMNSLIFLLAKLKHEMDWKMDFLKMLSE